ncbi:atypical chemokine receptor 1-like [Rhineura floridana]|uniref:atypical chemokine receptor 1-like n=1 Tax=Rhineura floridana TaxID=261503 RepID=UPI002AC8139D|nr:atypical chemokine receptor 1-like [Rhineura floridana]
MGNCIKTERRLSHELDFAVVEDLIDDWAGNYSYAEYTSYNSTLTQPCHSTYCSNLIGSIPAFLAVAGALGVLCNVALGITVAVCLRLWDQAGLLLATLSAALFAAVLPFFAVGVGQGWIFGDAFCQTARAVEHGCLFAQGLLVAGSVCQISKALPGVLLNIILWLMGFLLAIPAALISSTGEDGWAVCIPNQGDELRLWSLAHAIFCLAIFDILPVVVALANVVLKWQRLGWHPPMVITWLFYLLWAPYGVALILDMLLKMGLLTPTCSLRERFDYFLGLSEGLGVFHCFLCPLLILGAVIHHHRAAQ